MAKVTKDGPRKVVRELGEEHYEKTLPDGSVLQVRRVLYEETPEPMSIELPTEETAGSEAMAALAGMVGQVTAMHGPEPIRKSSWEITRMQHGASAPQVMFLTHEQMQSLLGIVRALQAAEHGGMGALY